MMIVQKSPTLVEPIPYGQEGSYGGNKEGVIINEQAISYLRSALSSGGAHGSEFVGPHRYPLYPNKNQRVKPQPTRRPITLSQEYVDRHNSKLIDAGDYPNLLDLH